MPAPQYPHDRNHLLAVLLMAALVVAAWCALVEGVQFHKP